MGLKLRLPWETTGKRTKAASTEGVRIVSPSVNGVAQYPTSTYYDFAAGAYQKNAVVFSCIQAIVQAFASSRLKIYSSTKDEEIPNHPLELLFKSPNPFTSPFLFWEQWWVNWFLDGNVYPTKMRNGFREVKELWLLRPDRMRIVPGDSYIKGYQHVVDGVPYALDVADVMHDRAYNPLNDYFGQSPLLAGLREIASDNEATDFVKVSLQNRGVSPGVAVLLEDNAVMLGEDEEARANESWFKKFSKDKRGSVGFFGGVKDIKNISSSMQDLMMHDIRALDEARICSIFGVPPIIVGILTGLENSPWSNIEEARKMFWQDTVEPLQKRVEDLINRRLVPDFGEGVYAAFDCEDASALAGVRAAALDSRLRALQAGVATINEVRVEADLDVIDGGDVLFRSIAIQTVDPNKKPEDPAPAKPEPAPPKPDDNPDNPDNPDIAKRLAARRVNSKDRFARVRHALGRSANAKRWVGLVHKSASKVFKSQGDSVLSFVSSATKAADGVTPDQEREELARKVKEFLTEEEKRWVELANAEMNGVMSEIALEAAESAGAEIGIAIGIPSDSIKKFVHDYSYKFAERISATSASDVRAIMERAAEEAMTREAMVEAFRTKFTEWTEARADMVARSETIRAANYGAKEQWKLEGVRQVEWLAAEDSCEYCLALDGKVVGIEDAFASLGDKIEADGVEPLVVDYESVDAPPAHPNCTCTLLSVEGDL